MFAIFRVSATRGVSLVSEITCLVGKNEAGKSTLLKALYHLNPVIPAEGISTLLTIIRAWMLKIIATGRIRESENSRPDSRPVTRWMLTNWQPLPSIRRSLCQQT